MKSSSGLPKTHLHCNIDHWDAFANQNFLSKTNHLKNKETRDGSAFFFQTFSKKWLNTICHMTERRDFDETLSL